MAMRFHDGQDLGDDAGAMWHTANQYDLNALHCGPDGDGAPLGPIASVADWTRRVTWSCTTALAARFLHLEFRETFAGEVRRKNGTWPMTASNPPRFRND